MSKSRISFAACKDTWIPLSMSSWRKQEWREFLPTLKVILFSLVCVFVNALCLKFYLSNVHCFTCYICTVYISLCCTPLLWIFHFSFILKTSFFLWTCNFVDDDCKTFEFQRANHLIHLLQTNDFYYAKILWENKNTWKESSKAKSISK